MESVNQTISVAEERLDDAELVERIRRSNIDAFRTLFERYQPVVFRDSLFRTRDSSLAHDIVQETFLRVWERRAFLRSHLSVLGYLLRISTNLVRDAARREQTHENLKGLVPQPSPSEGDNPEEALQLALLEERLSTIVNEQLPERCRAVFILSRIEGKSNQEIATLLRISVRTVEHQIGHALSAIRKALPVKR